jgi:hypothetical protein
LRARNSNQKENCDWLATQVATSITPSLLSQVLLSIEPIKSL